MARGPIPDKPRERPTVPDVLPLAYAYYEKPGNSAGGSLHSVLDDGNLEEHHVLSAFDRAAVRGDLDGCVLATMMLAMTGTQRRKVCAMLHAPPRNPLIEFESRIVIKGIDLTHPQ
jgi:hypothetical protein